jgi:vacuolar-type H+-ATPase subunit I/STV1
MTGQPRKFAESILRRLPGFGGYLQQERRRESDWQTREWMIQRLQQGAAGIQRYTLALVADARIDDLPLTDALRLELEQLIAELRSCVQGYSGLFDADKIDEDQLEDLLDNDATLLDEVDSLALEMHELGDSGSGPKQAIPGLRQRLQQLRDRLKQREDRMRNLVSGA